MPTRIGHDDANDQRAVHRKKPGNKRRWMQRPFNNDDGPGFRRESQDLEATAVVGPALLIRS
eukprot:CAMPEP_0170194642 /NCGR_PEP_ID=MMETSP0040_2-20121228/59708_1 /TAXON_ID=641309 /ORGANISM="Lotharella oceanica, Strain CCMP622" /LENGTH=61 /DNA_ID=CAMNT_0010443599 /DNA_START=179 /DNA_END=364 /DNA_ORIENTATION=+